MGRGNLIWGFVVLGGPNCGGDPMDMGDPFEGCTHLNVSGENRGEGEPDVGVRGSGRNQLWVGPNGYGGPFEGCTHLNVNGREPWGGGTRY